MYIHIDPERAEFVLLAVLLKKSDNGQWRIYSNEIGPRFRADERGVPE